MMSKHLSNPHVCIVTGSVRNNPRSANNVGREADSEPAGRDREASHCEEIPQLRSAIPQGTHAERRPAGGI